MSEITKTAYVLDDDYQIVSGSNTWDDFAAANDGESVFLEKILGHRLWEFVAGDVTKIWLEALLKFVEVRKEKVERPYRCDSPGVRRYMRMNISVNHRGLLQVEHKLLAVEKRSTPVYMQHKSKVPTAVQINRRCSMCGRIYRAGKWCEADDSLKTSEPVQLTVIYTICDDCNRLLPTTNEYSKMSRK